MFAHGIQIKHTESQTNSEINPNEAIDQSGHQLDNQKIHKS